MVETKRVPNSLGISRVSPQMPEQARMEAFDEDYKVTSSAIESHTEYTRQPPSTDVKVCDNTTTWTLSFGKETVDQAIQQGNARNVKAIAGHGVNGSTYSSVQANGQLNNTSRSTIAGNQPGLPTTVPAIFIYFSQRRTQVYKALARNEAFDRHYKAICVAGKSEGIEALKQDTDLNIAFERKSVVLIECIWVLSMTSTQSLASQGPHILARVRDVDFRLLESTGISKEASYLTRECRAAFREKVSESTGIHGVIGIVGRNSRRINCHCEELLRITGIHGVARNPQRRLPTRCQQENKKDTVKRSQHQLESSPVGHYNDSAEKYCWNQICPKYLANHGSVTANGLTGLVDVLCRLERKPLELKRLNGARRVDYHRVSGVLARFRDIDFNGYRHCLNPNTPIEAIRNPARQHQSRDVKVGDNPTARTLSFGKEIEEHAIQQGNVRVNNGMQQDIGELAAHSSPLS
ncbi:hypothetical protein R3P38DRAFT_2800221 [Favolaschia claudopus]|uniref:Uncharacterized protein n=1 Tax=Favolaschia claudopus TaxID=2862362 RepID=A0AAV9ZXA0_9AGAR